MCVCVCVSSGGIRGVEEYVITESVDSMYNRDGMDTAYRVKHLKKKNSKAE